MAKFGYTTTPQGYRLLNDKVRVIQGDGVDKDSIVKIMDVMIARGLAIGNIAFGMGGGLLQKVNRDDFGYAMKASAIRRGGIWHDVFKDPATAKSKRSKKGIQGAMVTDSGAFVARPAAEYPRGPRRAASRLPRRRDPRPRPVRGCPRPGLAGRARLRPGGLTALPRRHAGGAFQQNFKDATDAPQQPR